MSINTCDIEITTGINKGKLCRDINKYCRHKKSICEICKEEFSHRSSYLRHKKIAHGEKQKVAIVKRDKVKEMEKELELLKKQFLSVTKRMDKVECEPKNITVVIGDEKIFMGLAKRLGNETRASNFLLDNIEHKNSINIVDKMYLEGLERNKYPIACSDNYKFRYLNNSGDIVDDKGGIQIATKLENEIHSALIEANTHIITECMDKNDNTKLYNVYNIGTIQEKLGSYRDNCDKVKLRNDLARKVYNTEHPFFC